MMKPGIFSRQHAYSLLPFSKKPDTSQHVGDAGQTDGQATAGETGEAAASAADLWLMFTFPCMRSLIKVVTAGCNSPSGGNAQQKLFCCLAFPLFVALTLAFLAIDLALLALCYGIAAAALIPFSIGFGIALQCRPSLRIDTREKFARNLACVPVGILMAALFVCAIPVLLPAACCALVWTVAECWLSPGKYEQTTITKSAEK
jgi:hypothetical protein